MKKSFVKGLAPEVNAVLAEFELIIAQIRGEAETTAGSASSAVDNAEQTESGENAAPAAETDTSSKPKKGTKKAGTAAGRKKPSKSSAKPKKRNSWSGDEESDEGPVSEPEDEEEADDERPVKLQSKNTNAARKPLKDVANKLRGRA